MRDEHQRRVTGVDEELTTGPTTVSRASITDEADPGNKAQDLPQVATKVEAEQHRQGGGILGFLKGLFHHADRELAGEYERREDPDAPATTGAVAPEQQPPQPELRGR
jgi:hypothetical protein